MAEWKADFVSFALKLDVIDKDTNRIKVQQSDILRAFEKNRGKRNVVVKARQVFMTTWELARDLWHFFAFPNGNVLVIVPSDKDNRAIKTVGERLQTMVAGLKRDYPDTPIQRISDSRWVRTDVDEDGNPYKAEIIITGAGATEAAAGKKSRGGTVLRLHVTELAFFEFAKESLVSLLPALPPSAEVTYESTPNGATGAFYESYIAAKEGKSGYTAHFYPWFLQSEYQTELLPGEIVEPQDGRQRELVERHGVTPVQLKWYQQVAGDPNRKAKLDQEYPSDDKTCWLYDGDVFFDQNILATIRAKTKPHVAVALAGLLKIWEHPQPGVTYVIGADPAGGVGKDFSVAMVLERGSGRHVATLRGQIRPNEFARLLARLGFLYNGAILAVERNNAPGGSVLADLATIDRKSCSNGVFDGSGYPNMFYGDDKIVGWNTHKANRPVILDSLEASVRDGSYLPLDLDVVEEMFTFIVKDGRPEAANGATDDCVMASAIALAIARVSIGLAHTAFHSAPSIAFEDTPIAFEGLGIDADGHLRAPNVAPRPSVIHHAGYGGGQGVTAGSNDYDGF